MVTRVLVLALAVTCAVAFDLNCHMDQDRVAFIFGQRYSWVYEKCDRLMLNIGSLDKDGRLQVPHHSPMDKFQSSRKYNSNMKLFLKVEVQSDELSKLGKKEYRDNMVQTVAGLIMDKQLDGAVFDFDPKLAGTPPVAGVTKSRIYRLLGDLKKKMGSEGKTIGLVTPVGGPLQVKSPADCNHLDQVVDFIELSTHQLLVNSADNRLAHRSALGPLSGNRTQFNLETNIDHVLKTWLGNCDLMRPKLYLTVSPQGYGQAIKSLSSYGPLLEAGQVSHSFGFQQICKAKADRYTGWEGLVAILEHNFEEEDWLRKRSKASRHSFNTVTGDDIYGECEDGSLPLFTSVAEELKPSTVTPTTGRSLTTGTDTSASDKLDAMCQVAVKFSINLPTKILESNLDEQAVELTAAKTLKRVNENTSDDNASNSSTESMTTWERRFERLEALVAAKLSMPSYSEATRGFRSEPTPSSPLRAPPTQAVPTLTLKLDIKEGVTLIPQGLKEILRTKVQPRDGDAGVNRMRFLGKKSLLIVTRDIEAKRYLESQVKLKMQDVCTIGEPLYKMPTLRFEGLENDDSGSELKEALDKKFPEYAAKIRVILLHKIHSGNHQAAIVRVPKEIYNELISCGEFYFKYSLLKIKKHVHATLCYKCQRYGHISSNCPNETSCSFCAGAHSQPDI
ncbi:hypothetical protein HDE_03961 [Halotydeus destructor]|nr:hypothetical protein HDE_03961 [Halotydeus destructor]